MERTFDTAAWLELRIGRSTFGRPLVVCSMFRSEAWLAAGGRSLFLRSSGLSAAVGVDVFCFLVGHLFHAYGDGVGLWREVSRPEVVVNAIGGIKGYPSAFPR